MSKNMLVTGLKWVKNTSQCNKQFIENYNEDKNHFLEVDVQYLQKLCELRNGLSFLPERIKIKKYGKRVADLHDKRDTSKN